MANTKLEEAYTWEEVASMFQERIGMDKKFYEWFVSLPEKRVFFDVYTYARAYMIYKQLKKDGDHFFVVVGDEGSGKSTYAVELASIISPNTFSLDFITFEISEFLKVLGKAQKGDTILGDEALMFLFSRNAMSRDTKDAVSIISLIRQKNLNVILCIPDFFSIDRYIREHRVDTLVHVINRGTYRLFPSRKSIKKCSTEGRKYGLMGVKNTAYINGHFNKDFPTINGITHDLYKDKKKQHLDNKLQKMQDNMEVANKKEVVHERLRDTHLTITESMEYLSYADRKGFMEFMIHTNKIPNVRIGKRFYIKKDDLEKFKDYGTAENNPNLKVNIMEGVYNGGKPEQTNP